MKLKIKVKGKQTAADYGKTKIGKNTLIANIVATRPDLAEILTEDYGFHCVGCFASSMETIEQGALVHGMNEVEIKEMLDKLNQLI
jgi:hydroxylamine reductase